MAESITSTLKSIGASVTSFFTGLFSHLEPYDLVDLRKDPNEYDIPRETTLNELNNRLKYKSKDGNVTLFTRKELDSAFEYLSFIKELKPGETIQAKDGRISYEDFQQVMQDAENVSQNDYSFGGKMPKIFVMPKLPPEYSREREILDLWIGATKGNMIYNPTYDTISIVNGTDNFTVAEHEAFFFHEAGHRIRYANNGVIAAKYDLNKHAHALLGDKFAEGCEGYVFDGKLQDSPELRKYISDLDPNGKCADTLKQIDTDRMYAVDPKIKNKNIGLSHIEESGADEYVALSNRKYGEALSNYFRNNNYAGNDTHPSTLQRADQLAQILANPAYYKEQLEKKLAELKQHAPEPSDSDELKKPAATPVASAGSNNIRTSH